MYVIHVTLDHMYFDSCMFPAFYITITFFQAWDLWQEGKGLELVDPTISDSCVEYQVIRCIHVSLLCVEDGAVDRPTMSDMLSMLTNESIQLPLPKKPAFSIGRKAIEANMPNRESGVHTVNGLSISEMDAR